MTRNLAWAAAATIDSVARAQERKKQPEEPVLVLAANASAKELRDARIRRAVRKGSDVYLPSWREAATGLPNVFLRSALFGAANAQGVAVMEETIASQGNTSLTLTGFRLCDYDRRVFAACLNYYRDDRPLSQGAEATWVTVTFWQLAKDLKVTYGANVHAAIHASLIRLNAAHLRVRVRGKDIPLPHLIEVAFDGCQESVAHSASRGSDLVVFRILESMAKLFGPTDWSAVSESALHEYSGLDAWLNAFYSTHSKPYPMSMADLLCYSGSVCDLREFRRRLGRTLTKLSCDDVPDAFRIAGFSTTKTHATIELLRWCVKH
jgi:hypothetical protein